MPKYVLGLDLGASSVGWAIIELANGNPAKLIDAGVRIFPAIVERKEIDSQPKNKNAERRAKRGSRRVKSRRVSRKQRLLQLFFKTGLLPQNDDERKKLFDSNPYELRAKALDEKLELHEFARAIYHLCQRRGFKSNRKDVPSDEEERRKENQTAEAINKLREDIRNAKARTLGEFLYSLSKNNLALETGVVRIRDRNTSREMFESEFEQIWSKQSEYYPEVLSEELKKQIHDDIIFHQRSFDIRERLTSLPRRANAWRSPQVANCSLIPIDKLHNRPNKRCSAGTWVAQQFRLLKEVNNIRVYQPFQPKRQLKDDERKKLIAKLSRQKEMKFTEMRDLLCLPRGSSFNLQKGEDGEFNGNIVEAALVSAFGEEVWDKLDEEKRNSIRKTFCEEDDPDQLRNEAKKWGLDNEQIEMLIKTHLPRRYMSYSEKAMEVLLPYLEQGLSEYQAIIQARQDGKLETPPGEEEQAFLPKPQEIPNPNVVRCLHETRKVVNAIIREYGKPSKIVVELARELKITGKERERIIEVNDENKRLNKEAEQFYSENGRPNPSKGDLLRYRLWKEQSYLCPYSGKQIDAAALLQGDNVVQVDHILPYSLSLNDSYNNKILCFTESNKDKLQCTPFQWKGGPDSQEYKNMILFIEKNMKRSKKNKEGMNKAKVERFKQEKVDIDEVISQKLNDTRYVSREVAKYLNLLYPPDERIGQERVFTSPGMVTAALRYRWGLDTILGKPEKNREDHRHHAIDAIVIACTNPSRVKALSDARQSTELNDDEMKATSSFLKALTDAASKGGKKFRLAPPWDNFRVDVEHIICNCEKTWKFGEHQITTRGILVSHKPDKGLSGALHEETSYGIPKDLLKKLEQEGLLEKFKQKPGTLEEGGEFVYTVPVTDLTPSQIEGRKKRKKEEEEEGKIRDLQIRKIIREHYHKYGNPKKWKNNLPHLPKSIPIKKVRILKKISKPLILIGKDGVARAKVFGNNHHIEIVETTDKKGRKRWDGFVVTTLEAARRARITKEPIVKRDHSEGKKFVMSLSRSESVFLTMDDGTIKPYRVQKMDVNGIIVFRSVTHAGKLKNSDKPPLRVQKNVNPLMGEMKAVKVNIDPLGRVYPAHD